MTITLDALVNLSVRFANNFAADDGHDAACLENFGRGNFHDVSRKHGEVGEHADLSKDAVATARLA
jgi:hypothetical protein